MFLFQPPPPTRFDLRFSVAGFPVRVHPLFWLIAILFGSSAGSPAKVMAWIIAIFVSITIHELGHAFALRRYGVESQIILHAAGGLTVPESVSWGGSSKRGDFAKSANIHFSCWALYWFYICRSASRGLRCFGRRNCPKFHIRICSLSLRFIPSGMGNFDFLFDEPALGEHLLGTYQPYARPPIGRRKHYQIHFDPNRSIEWITYITLGFGDHRRSGCHSKYDITTQHLHGDLIWHAGIPEFSNLTKWRRKVLRNIKILHASHSPRSSGSFYFALDINKTI